MRASYFACPVCGAGLVAGERALRCPAGHNFDIARQGYVSLMRGGSRARGDTAAMVAARVALLRTGLFSPVADGLVRALVGRDSADSATEENRQIGPAPVARGDSDSGRVAWGRRGAGGVTRNPGDLAGAERSHPIPARPRLLDVGGGPGWYSAYVLDRLPEYDGVLLDASAAAARVAARAHPRLTVATADVWQHLPLPDASVDAALVVFAPRPPDLARVVRPGGWCLVVTPRAGHLAELRVGLPLLDIDPDKDVRLAAQFEGWATASVEPLEYQRELGVDDLANLVAMGPAAFHASATDIAAQAAAQGPTRVTVSVAVRTFVRPVRAVCDLSPSRAKNHTQLRGQAARGD